MKSSRPATVIAPLFSSTALLPLSEPGGVSYPMPNTPGVLRPYSVTLAVPMPLTGKHNTSSTTRIPLAAFDDENFRFILQLTMPGLGPVGHTIRDSGEGIFLVTEDDTSWVEISPDTGNGSTVLYGGPRLLWPDIADTWHRWNDFGRPERSRFGLTAHDDGRQQTWLDQDSPDAVVWDDAGLPR